MNNIIDNASLIQEAGCSLDDLQVMQLLLKFFQVSWAQRQRLVFNNCVNLGVSGEIVRVVEAISQQAIQLVIAHRKVQPTSQIGELS